MKWLKRGTVLLLALLALGVAGAWTYSRSRCRRPTARSAVARARRPRCGSSATRTASRRSVPRLAEAAMFGLGFVHAQDRLWQLETHRRIGSGRLAEAFGAAGARDRPLPARARRAPRRGGAVGEGEPRGRAPRSSRTPPASMRCCRRHARAPARVRAARPAARAVDAGRQHRLGDHDGVGPRRQLVDRAAAHAARAEDAGRAHRRAAPAVSGRAAAARPPTTRRCSAA